MIFLIAISCSGVSEKDAVPPTVTDVDIYDDPAGDSNSERFVLSTQMILNRSGRLFITDRETGSEVWSLSNPDDPVWSDARMGLEGDRIWHNVVDVRDHDPTLSEFRAVDVEGRVLEQISVFGAHHSFDILPDGDLVTIISEIREDPTHGPVAGDRVVRISDGTEQTVLSTFSIMNPQPLTEMWNFGHFDDAKDWTHANCIRWDSRTETLLLTVPGVNALWSFDLDGRITGVYLGKGMDATPYQQGPRFAEAPFPIYAGGVFELPHGAAMDADGLIWVMSTGIGGQSISHAEGYSIDGDGLVLATQIPNLEGGHSAGLGGVLKLEQDDSVLINWGIFGIIEEVDADGQRPWRIEAGLQNVFGISTTTDDLSDFLQGSE